MSIVLSAEELELLMRPVRGKGGWQSLLRKLQRQVSGATLVLDHSDVAKVCRYRDKYGSGGWQGRLGFLKRHKLDSAA
jgi:hypothetical protein